MPQSEALTKFYQEYLEWLEKGAPHNQPFSRSAGLCVSVWDTRSTFGKEGQLRREIESQFKALGCIPNGFGAVYPFGSEEDYESEMNKGEAHLNKKRIAWVKDHANG